MSFEKPAIVIDNGSRYIKAGFACDNHPVSMFRTVVGRPSYLNGRYSLPGRADFYDVCIGDDAVARTDDYELHHPVVNGRIVHWDNMERVWHHIFYRELKAAPEDRAVILACSSATPMEEKIKCCELFFEVLNVPAVCIQPQNVLTLYGSGYTTGITVDLGYDTTDISPVYEGGLISYAHMATGLAAAQISAYLKDSFEKRQINLGVNHSATMEELVKKYLHVTQDLSMPWKNHEKMFKLPDGKSIEVSNEMFMAGELFFQPDFVKGETTKFLPLHETIVSSSIKCDAELRGDLYAAVVLSGGLSMIPGICSRLYTELETALKKPVNVVPSAESYVVAWMGGATFAGIPDARKIFVTKKQFEEYGGRIVKNRFI